MWLDKPPLLLDTQPLMHRSAHVSSDRVSAPRLPRISAVSPGAGSLAGGAVLTVHGSGFGSAATALRVSIAGSKCIVLEESLTHGDRFVCRVSAAASASGDASSGAQHESEWLGERGARWRLHSAGSTGSSDTPGSSDTSELLLDNFALPAAWGPQPQGEASSFLEGWFEPPVSGDVSFLLHSSVQAKLHWSGSEVLSTRVGSNAFGQLRVPLICLRSLRISPHSPFGSPL